MLTYLEKDKAAETAKKLYDSAGIIITEQESNSLEVADFGLGRFAEFGLTLLVYVNTNRVCAKEMVLLPHQICPEHRHPDVAGELGKEETFRCRWGQVYLYVPGEVTPHPKGFVPKDKKNTFTVWNEIVLNPGEQYTLEPDTWHWFQAGPDGAMISEFSTKSRDEADIFRDLQIKRVE